MFFAYNSTLIVNFCQFFFDFFLLVFQLQHWCFFILLFYFLFFNKFTALPSSALIFVFYCNVETFAFRVTARLEDPKPVTSQHPCCLFEYFTRCVLVSIDVSNKNKINRSFVPRNRR